MPCSDNDDEGGVKTPVRRRHRRAGQRYWSASTILGGLFLWFVAAAFATGGWVSYTKHHDHWDLSAALSLSLLVFSVPIFGYHLRNRDAEIACPQMVIREGRPAMHFPGDRRAVPVSAAGYALLGGVGIGFSMSGWTGHVAELIPFGLPAVFFLTYTLFAVLGRFDESGTFLDETGVTIRARGLRAQLPWSSIAGAEIVKHWPFPYPRIAIHLHPGTPRDVSTTVPWWIGSPRPRRNTVYLTRVQVPGMIDAVPDTTPASWIDLFAHQPPTRQDLEKVME